jgi:predicted phosphodiesterase
MSGSAPQHQKTKPIAILSDVHANLPALDRALEQIAKHDVARIVCAGDLVGYGPEPNQVLDLVLEAKVECIWGNHDRWTLREPHNPNAFGGVLLDARHVKTLEALPEALSFVHQGRGPRRAP